jgi:hypothetical protein
MGRSKRGERRRRSIAKRRRKLDRLAAETERELLAKESYVPQDGLLVQSTAISMRAAQKIAQGDFVCCNNSGEIEPATSTDRAFGAALDSAGKGEPVQVLLTGAPGTDTLTITYD